ncbi:MAG: OmpW family protein [Burkholderia sp.]|jgi:outer membrane protein W|uniref:OmpW/AlkL family protein n=1 Tax=Burkholderia sp. TaxID=36773 RepID=UPI002587D993|nr:OmpW family outer membrane protein [Burkholderia sp.]MCA3776269.1 OmpW family protein [Burkholderia sp.]MCA3784531.1 OmpW family protein [Burkholderia sp.]MCA3790916.1 OmpW family protein [Burkholderia sp.]MCA3799727.1 OmpW family protein [Burkholderia sp.]MCA3810475.1 OmpW family protein [Burkholderia sp.]
MANRDTCRRRARPGTVRPLSRWLGATLFACAAAAHGAPQPDGDAQPRWQAGADGIGFWPGGDADGFDASAWATDAGPARGGRDGASADVPPADLVPLTARKITLGQRTGGAGRACAAVRDDGVDGIGFDDSGAAGGCDPAAPRDATADNASAGGVVHADRMPYELHPVDPSRLPDLPAAQAPPLLEQLMGDDRNMVGLGWHFIATTGRSTPVTTHTDALGLNSFQNAGSSLSLSNSNTLAFTFTHFFSENWAAEAGGGIPPVLTLGGHGSIALPLDRIFSGVQGRFPLIDLANTQSNPLATTRAWLGSVVFKYYLGERDDRFRPFAGIGISYTRFTNTNLNPVFQRKLASLGGLLAAGGDIGSLQSLLLDPALFQRIWDAGGDLLLSGRTNVSAKVKSVWEPVFTVGASYQITRQLWVTGMVTYIPLRTKITLDISQSNRTLASNTFDISANPVLASVLLNFRF